MADKFFDGFQAFVLFFCKVCMVILILCITLVVGGRLFFSWTPRWGEEAALMAMVWLGLTSASLSVANDKHIRITMIDSILPKKVNWVLEFLVLIIVAGYAIVILYTGYEFTMMSVGTVMPGLIISRAFLSAAAPVAGLAMLIACIGRARMLIWKRTP